MSKINKTSAASRTRSAFARALIAAAVIGPVAGCSLDTGDSSNASNRIGDPRGDIQGVVLDVTGTPVQGVEVSVGLKTVKTNAQGVYYFRDIPATGLTLDGNNVVATPINISIDAPEGMLRAVAQVAPTAPVQSDTNDESDGQDAGGDDAEGNAVISTYLDGFLAAAEPVYLPKLTGTYFRCFDNAWTGAAIANQAVDVTFEVRTNGVVYQGVNYDATTDAEGCVNLTGLPIYGGQKSAGETGVNADGAYGHLRMPGWVFETNKGADEVEALQVVANEQVNQQVEHNDDTSRDVQAHPVTAEGDRVNPTVASVGGVLSVNDTMACSMATKTAFLQRDVDGTAGLVLSLSEPVVISGSSDLAGDNSVVVYNHSAEVYVDATASLNNAGTQLTVTTNGPVGEGDEFSIFIRQSTFLDAAGNQLGMITGKTPAYVAEGIGASVWAEYMEVCLHTQTDINIDPDAPTMAVQVNDDPEGTDPLENTNVVTAAVESVSDEGLTTAFGPGATLKDYAFQLNDASGELVEVETALSDLAKAFGDTVNGFEADAARVEFLAVDGVSSYTITIDGGAPFTVTQTQFDDTVNIGGTNDVGVTTAERAGVEKNVIIWRAAQSGDVITIAANDDLGAKGEAVSVTVFDNTAPTAVLNSSYQKHHDFAAFGKIDQDGGITDTDAPYKDLCNIVATTGNHAGVWVAAAGSPDSGDGGELAGEGVEGTGAQVVCLGVSPELLIPSDGDVTEAFADLESGRNALFGEDNNESGGDADLQTSIPRRAYDATAFAAWTPAPVEMGVAFSEDIAISGAPTATTSAVLSGFRAQNDTAVSHLPGDAPRVKDLVAMTVDNVLTFANVDHGQNIDFTSVVTDLAATAGAPANNSASAAVVKVRDIFPPMMTSAVRNITGEFVITFDTPVVIEDGDIIGVGTGETGGGTPVAITLDSTATSGTANSGAFTQSVDGKTITVAAADLPATFNAAFGNADLFYAEGGTDRAHAIVDWRFIADERGNTWATHNQYYGDGTAGQSRTNPNGDDDSPLFIAIDLIGPFNVSVTATDYEDGEETFVIEYAFSHPIDLTEALNLGVGQTIADINEGDVPAINAAFAISVGGGAPAAYEDFVVTYNSSTNTLTVTVDLAGAATLSDGDTFDIEGDVNGDVESGIQAGELVDPPIQTVGS